MDTKPAAHADLPDAKPTTQRPPGADPDHAKGTPNADRNGAETLAGRLDGHKIPETKPE